MQNALISAPLKELERLIAGSFAEVESWLRAANAQTPPPFYSSVDLRNNGKKIVPVDTNLFPGGFNNLSPNNYPLATEAIRHQIDLLCPSAKSILLIPENHTRNIAYLDNVAVLRHLLEMAGITVRLARLNGEAEILTSASGKQLDMQIAQRDGGRLHCGDFYPCAVLLNNDLSAGSPPLLEGLEIPILPAAQLGWATRKKSAHFFQYQRVAEEFAALLNADPWLFCADFFVCPKVDFQKREGMECLATAVEETLSLIREKYQQHGIGDKPYVVVKANVGTYGMGVMRFAEPSEVFSLNRKQRNSMAVGKDGMPVRDVLIQEGVRTLDQMNDAAAEPVVYMMGGAVVGGFYRINAERGDSDNLNSRGMSFSPLPFEAPRPPPSANDADGTAARLYVYSVIARLANLAAAREQSALENPLFSPPPA